MVTSLVLHQQGFRCECKTSPFGTFICIRIITKINQYISITTYVQKCPGKIGGEMVALAKGIAYALFIKIGIK